MVLSGISTSSDTRKLFSELNCFELVGLNNLEKMRTTLIIGVWMFILPIMKSSQQTTSKEKIQDEITNSEIMTQNITDRQRRLIPYMTYYTKNNNYQLKNERKIPNLPVHPILGKILVIYEPKYNNHPEEDHLPKSFTPFLSTNKLPGGFTPIRQKNPGLAMEILDTPTREVQPQPQIQSEIEHIQPIQPQVQPQIRHQIRPQIQPQTVLVSKEPSYSRIFDKLLQLKQLQYTAAPQYQNPKVITQYYTRNYATPRPPSQYIENYRPVQPAKTYIHTYTPSNIDIFNENKVQNYENFEAQKTYNQVPAPAPSKEYEQQIVVPVKNYQVEQEQEYHPQQIHQPQQVHQPQQIPQEEKIYEPIIIRPIYRPIPVKSYRPVYQTEPASSAQQYTTQNPHSLSVILKQLQDSNTLPHTLTPDNIDNSIKTLVQILNALKHTQKFQKPIVVAPVDESTEEQDNGNDYDDSILPETVSQNYPANTPEGGTPGKPGVDYPAYSFIPQTNFNCKKQRYKGFFGDPDTHCQVWHYCDLNGGQASFLCPNGTIFSQVALTCDWWYNVKCATTTQLYVLNERLYKYILPFTPKFPEDYSGPLVDRYLALKFKEMEEKMKKQKKGKTEKSEVDTQNAEINKLQDIESDSEVESVAEETQEHTTKTTPDN